MADSHGSHLEIEAKAKQPSDTTLMQSVTIEQISTKGVLEVLHHFDVVPLGGFPHWHNIGPDRVVPLIHKVLHHWHVIVDHCHGNGIIAVIVHPSR